MPGGLDSSTLILGDYPVDPRIHFAPPVWPEKLHEPGRLSWPLDSRGLFDAQIAQLQSDLREAVNEVRALAAAPDAAQIVQMLYDLQQAAARVWALVEAPDDDDVLQKIQALEMAKDEFLRGAVLLADHPSSARIAQENLYMFDSYIAQLRGCSEVVCSSTNRWECQSDPSTH